MTQTHPAPQTLQTPQTARALEDDGGTAPGRHRPVRTARPTRADAGMATAEYAIATLAACGFAALLLAVLSSGEVRGMLLALVQRALSLV